VSLVLPSPILERWRRWDAGSRQRVNSYWRDIANTDPFLRNAVLCVEMVFGGDVVVRIARTPLRTVSGIDGSTYLWAQGIVDEPEIQHGIDMSSQAAAARSVTFRTPAGVVKPSDIIARGGMLAGVAEVSLQVNGGDYDLRYVLLRGDMTGGIDFGAGGAEQLQVQIADPRETQSLKVPKYAVDTDRWPLAQDSAIGARYPLVLNGYPKVPCVRVLDDHGVTGLKYLVCAPGRDLQIDAVYVNGEVAAGVYLPATETDDRDALGSACKTIDFSSSAGPWEDNDSVYADLSLKTGKRALSLIRCIQKLLEGYTALGHLGLNPDLFGFAETRMPGVAPQIIANASGEDAVDVLDFIESTLLASFPMVHMMYEGRGMGPVVLDRRKGPDNEGIAIQLTGAQFPLIERLTNYVETPKSDLYNAFELRYGYDAQDNTYSGIVSRSARNSVACELSERMAGGTRTKDTIDSPFIMSKTLANYVIDWLVAHLTLPAYDVEWSCVPALLLRLRVGQNVLYTDPKFPAFTATTTTILGFTYTRGEASIKLRVWHPAWKQLLLGSV